MHERTRHLIKSRDYFGDTPLDLASRAARADTPKPAPEILDVIDILLRHGAEHSLSASDLWDPLSPSHCMVGIDQLGSIISPVEDVTSNYECMLTMRFDHAVSLNLDVFKVPDVNSNAELLQQAGYSHNYEQVTQQLRVTGLANDVPTPAKCNSFLPVFKTYSPVKMALISMLKSASCEQMVAPVRFDFGTWLDSGPEAFVLKVTSLDMTDWLYQQTHTAWPLRELCRGTIRRQLGYRAHEKVHLLPLPKTLRDFLNMTELEEINTKEIRIRSTGSYDDIDME